MARLRTSSGKAIARIVSIDIIAVLCRTRKRGAPATLPLMRVSIELCPTSAGSRSSARVSPKRHGVMNSQCVRTTGLPRRCSRCSTWNGRPRRCANQSSIAAFTKSKTCGK